VSKDRFLVLRNVVMRAKTPDIYKHWDVFEDFESAERLCEVEGIGWKSFSKQSFDLMGWKGHFCKRLYVT
jgi:hypothetical protein